VQAVPVKAIRTGGWFRKIGVPCFAAIAAVMGADALLFRTPLYPSYLEPDSSTGVFEMTLRRELEAQSQVGDNLVVTLGDSRFGYHPRLANQLTGETGYVFRTAGAAGSDARGWYYMMRDLDPTARRYRAIVIGMNDYDDEDGSYDQADDTRALHYVIARLRWSDVLQFTASFHDIRARWEVFRGSILKGIVYQSDLLAFLSHPRKRIDYVHLSRRGYAQWTHDYEESPRSMTGLQVDWVAWTATFPPGADQIQVQTVKDFLMYKPYAQNGWTAAYRRLWFGRLLDRYRDSPTRIIFLRLPRGPVVRPADLVHKKSSSIRELASQPGVTLIDEHAFDSLEHPELFKDGLHLNREGVARFSAMMAREVAKTLRGGNGAL